MDEQYSSGPEAYTLANLLMILAAIEMESREVFASALLPTEANATIPVVSDETANESRESDRLLVDMEESHPAVDFSAGFFFFFFFW